MLSVGISLTNKETIHSNIDFRDKQEFMRYLNNYDYIIAIEKNSNNEVIINTKEIVCVK